MIGPDERSGSFAGSGCRGPDNTWPGRNGGTGLTAGGIGRPGAITATGGCAGGGVGAAVGAGAGGAAGVIPANGGRIGCTGRPVGRSIAGLALVSVVLSSVFGAASGSTARALGAASAAGAVSTTAVGFSGCAGAASSAGAGASGTS